MWQTENGIKRKKEGRNNQKRGGKKKKQLTTTGVRRRKNLGKKVGVKKRRWAQQGKSREVLGNRGRAPSVGEGTE